MLLGFVPNLVFWIALLVGITERSRRSTAVFLVLWAVGYVGSGWIRGGSFLFQSWVAVLAIALIFQLLKNRIPLR
jgi:hypothetical protein